MKPLLYKTFVTIIVFNDGFGLKSIVGGTSITSFASFINTNILLEILLK